MNSLVIHIISSPDGGGAEFLVREINKELNDNGLKSLAIFFNNPRNISLKNNEYQLSNFSAYNPINFIILFFFLLKKTRIYKKVILHGHLTHALYFLMPFSFLKKFSLIYTEHNSYNKRRDIKFLRPFERFVYSRYVKVISISHFVENELTKWLGFNKNKFDKEKFVVILNGTKLYPFVKRNFNKKKFNLLSIGSLTNQKSFDLSIQAINKNKEYIDKYYILGEGPQREYLKKLILKSKLEDFVELVGFADPEVFLSRCDIGLIPSKWEGFGLASIEMVSSGIPLIISNVKGMADLFTNIKTVSIVKDREIYSWSFAIKNLITNIKHYEKLVLESSNSVANFSITKMAENYKKEYLKILEF